MRVRTELGRAALATYNVGAGQKRLRVVLDEKSPTYAPTFVRVTPAELVAVGDE